LFEIQEKNSQKKCKLSSCYRDTFTHWRTYKDNSLS